MLACHNYDNYNRPTLVSSNVGAFGQTNTSYGYAGGNLTTTIIDPAGQSTAKVTDASGQVVQATDLGGTLSYVYNSQGNLTSVTKSGVTLTSSQFDAYGRQTSLTDQNAGTTAYVYDALGQLTSQTNANGQTTALFYDILGRNTSRVGAEGTTSYDYFSNANGASTGRLKKITSFAGNLEEYTYDSYGRMATAKETVDGGAYQTNFGYNIYGDITSKDYPSGFGTRHSYDANGYPTFIKNFNNTVTIYTNGGLSSHGVNTSYTLGNNQTSTITHFHGLPLRYLTPGIQDLTQVWNYQNGNLTQRRDNIRGREENFVYDALNRLTTATVVGQAAQTVNYGNIGNIDSKTDAGTYTYQPGRPNAVTSVTNPLGVVPSVAQTIAYTAFAQPFTVNENNYQTTYTYGADYERIKSVTMQNGTEIGRRYYFGDYERITEGANTAYIHYVTSPAGLIAIVARPLGTSADGIYYTYTDHLGSILRLVRPDATIVTSAEQSFDAWGRRRNPDTWVPIAPTATTGLPYWLIRGYTSHEHLDQFGLINMNGRLYDPALGRVLSADNFVVGSSSTQAYNRYTYALNNPLTYSDPNGEFVVAAVLIGAAISAGIGYIGGRKAGLRGWDLAGYTFGSAIIGGISGGVGASVGAGVLASLSFGGFAGGFVAGSAGGAAGGFVGGFYSTALRNVTFSSNNNVLLGGLKGAAMGGLAGGVFGGAARGISDYGKGYSFWDGSTVDEIIIQGGNPRDIAANYNSSSQADTNDEILKIRMKSEYGVSEGDFNIRKITTRTNSRYGIDNAGNYVKMKTGQTVGGYARRFTTGYSSLHVSPNYTLAGDVAFRSVAGHELIHAYHNFRIPNFNGIFSERVAHRYTYDTYMRAGQFNRAFAG